MPGGVHPKRRPARASPGRGTQANAKPAASTSGSPLHAPRGAAAPVNLSRLPTGAHHCPFHFHEREGKVFFVLIELAEAARGEAKKEGAVPANEEHRPMPTLPADDDRAVAVVTAIRGGDVAGLREQLSADPELARATIVDHQGVARTLLHVVSDWPGHFPNGARTVALLIGAGADVNAPVRHAGPASHAETALHWAASSNDTAVLDALLDGGADIEAPGAIFTGGSPMSDAVVFAQWQAARRLLQRGAATTLWQAAALGLLDRVRQHLRAQPPPPPEQVTNAFWHACRGGQLEVAEQLLERGADPRWLGYDGKTPLDVARQCGVPELEKWLERQLARG